MDMKKAVKSRIEERLHPHTTEKQLKDKGRD